MPEPFVWLRIYHRARNLRGCVEDYSTLVCERDAARFVSAVANFSELARIGGLFLVRHLQKIHIFF